ncbi:MAG: hypothetical protein ACLVJ8_15295 [Ruthenibacterium lactatiformans]
MEVELLLPAPVRSILSTLQQQGHSAFAVGGCVRDSLMGRAAPRLGRVHLRPPREIKAAFPGKCLSAPGIRHGTVTVLLEHTPYEVTTFRTDGAYSDHRRPDSVRFVRSVTDDLARRDFTVNAMAYSPAAGLIDPFGGAADLAENACAAWENRRAASPRTCCACCAWRALRPPWAFLWSRRRPLPHWRNAAH